MFNWTKDKVIQPPTTTKSKVKHIPPTSSGAAPHTVAKYSQTTHAPLVQIFHAWSCASDLCKFCIGHFPPHPTSKHSLPVVKFHSPFLSAPRRLRLARPSAIIIIFIAVPFQTTRLRKQRTDKLETNRQHQW